MQRKIKVVEFVTRLVFGGAESMILNYVSHFDNLEDFDFHIVTQDINDPKCIEAFEKSGFTVHIVTHKRKSIFRNLQEIFRILKDEKFDIVHSHMTLTNFTVLFLAKTLKIPIRISHSHSAFNETGVQSKLIDIVLKKLNQISSNVWLACGYKAGVFLYGEKSVDNGKVLIMNNAIDLEKFRYNNETREKIREQYAMNNAFCIGQVGRFVEVKNHFYTLQIFKEIVKNNPNSKLILIGDGELKEELQEQVQTLDIKDKVIFTGNISNINEVYQAMDVLLLPSFNEGLPMVSIEAQVSGLACFISDRVDPRCAVTPNVKFLSINEPAEKWAKAILSNSTNTVRYSSEEILTEAGYNIKFEAKKLELLYRKSVSN